MKKVFKWSVIVIALVVAIFVVGGVMLPGSWTVSESIAMSASEDKVFEQVANLRNWQNWSPWTKEKDPTQVYMYEGPEIGAGAKWLWTSEKMGKGYLVIKEADMNSGIKYELFIDMNNSQSTINGAMNFSREDDMLKVSWTDDGDAGNNLVKRWMSLFVKQMLSKEMKAGLEKLKALVEIK
ncbi:MAG TPA: SRPBCC family protein [Myxococcota bacterium]|nr:SRPBCC family protein [Myxococcota bacterium]